MHLGFVWIFLLLIPWQLQENVQRTRFGPDNDRSIWILFHMPARTVLDLDADTCANLSAYLIQVHDQFSAFHNGGPRSDLACAPDILERRFSQQPEVTGHFCGGSICYHIGSNAGAALREACQTLQRKMNRIVNISFPQKSQNDRDAYSIFRQYHIQYPEEPAHLSDPNVFAGHYRSMADLQQEVLTAQRWCIFHDVCCDLLATRLGTANTGGFDLLKVRGTGVVRQAHNWYVDLQGGLRKYRVPVTFVARVSFNLPGLAANILHSQCLTKILPLALNCHSSDLAVFYLGYHDALGLMNVYVSFTISSRNMKNFWSLS